MRKKISQLLDLAYGSTKYSWGWFKPAIIRGDFKKNKNGYYQKLFFEELLKQNFKKTRWQLIFPNQTAGLIKKKSQFNGNANEYHIRFYSDGTIDCELEVDRFNGLHWAGPRNNGNISLEKILNRMGGLSIKDKDIIRSLFCEKDYSNKCVRKLK